MMGIHLSVRPLHLLGDVQARVQHQLVQVPHLLGEARLPVAALLRGAELVLEEGVVLGADDGEVVAHLFGVVVVCISRSSCRPFSPRGSRFSERSRAVLGGLSVADLCKLGFFERIIRLNCVQAG